MRSFTRTALILTFMLASGVATLSWWMLPISPPQTAVQLRPTLEGSMLKTPPNFDWSSLGVDDWRQLASWFDAATPQNGFRVHAIVKPGETVISSAYEGQQGELIITQLVPSLIRENDGASFVEVDVLTRAMTVSGTQRIITQRNLKLPAKGGYTLITPIPAPSGHGYSECSYAIHVSAQIEPKTAAIDLTATGEFKDRSTIRQNAPNQND